VTKELPPEAITEIKRGKRINAIRVVRAEWGVSLRDAKEIVDRYVSDNFTNPTQETSLAPESAELDKLHAALTELLCWVGRGSAERKGCLCATKYEAVRNALAALGRESEAEDW
jgi:hypothetical protein